MCCVSQGSLITFRGEQFFHCLVANSVVCHCVKSYQNRMISQSYRESTNGVVFCPIVQGAQSRRVYFDTTMSSLVYGCETWILNDQSINRVNVAWNKAGCEESNFFGGSL